MKVRFEVNLSTLGKQEVPKTTKYTANYTNGPLQRIMGPKSREEWKDLIVVENVWREKNYEKVGQFPHLFHTISLNLSGIFDFLHDSIQNRIVFFTKEQ